MGEATAQPLRVDFDRRIKLEFHGARITSDGGLLAYRELDDAFGLTDVAITQLLDGRRGKNGRHTLGGLFRQSVFGRLAGYEGRVEDGRGSVSRPVGLWTPFRPPPQSGLAWRRFPSPLIEPDVRISASGSPLWLQAFAFGRSARRSRPSPS